MIGKGGRGKGAGDVSCAHSGFLKMRYEVAPQAPWQESVSKTYDMARGQAGQTYNDDNVIPCPDSVSKRYRYVANILASCRL